MHILRPQFRMAEQAALQFAAERGFGIVVASDERGPRASHVPFVIARRGERRRRANAPDREKSARRAGRRQQALPADRRGRRSYVSNDWYASRDNVSTWLYEAVHLSGVAHQRALDENRAHGDALLAVSEARLPKQPWELAAMEPAKRETMLASIRVIDIVVDQIEGQSKLNQHKSDADHVAVANQLARSEETAKPEAGAEDARVAAGVGI